MMHRVIACALVVGSLIILPCAFSARAGAEPERVELILAKLPPQSSATYRAIRKLAGEGTRQVLALTKSEMWSVPKANVNALKAAAEAQGASVIQLGTDWNEVLRPMPGARGTAERKKAVQERARSSKETMRIFMTERQKIMKERAEVARGTIRVSMMLAPPPGVVEYALTKDVSDKATAQIKLPVNEQTVLTLTRTAVAVKSDVIVWRGEADATGGPVTLMWWPDGKMTGTIQHQGRIYSIRHMGGEMIATIEMSEDRMPPEHAAMSSRPRTNDPNLRDEPLEHPRNAAIQRPAVASSSVAQRMTKAKREELAKTPTKPETPQKVTINVIVAYTKKAAGNYTDVHRELIDLAIEEANESFVNSHLDFVKLRLVHAYQTDYVEQGQYFDHIWRFADRGDGYMDEIHGLRDEYYADVAVLIVDDPSGCGLATRVFADAPDAFAVVHHGCAAVTYSLAHEIGHLIGARHDLKSDDIMTPFPYGHGYVNDDKWRDIMSLRESCGGCPRLPIWSGPKVLVNGEPAGNAETSDTARVIAEQAARVANFRANQLDETKPENARARAR
jgi:hypothetical protein